MKTKVFGLILISLIFVAAYFLGRSIGTHPDFQITPKTPTSSITRPSFQELIRESRPTPKIKIQRRDEETETDKKCILAYSPLLELKLSNESKLEDFPQNLGACEGETEQISDTRKLYDQYCNAHMNSQLTDEEKQKNFLECVNAFILLRSTANAFLHRKENISEISDLRLLADILLGSVGHGDVDRFEEAASRMHILAPEMYEPLKANIAARVMRASQHIDDERTVAEMMNLLEKDIQAAQSMNNQDPELQEAILLARTKMMTQKDRLPDLLSELRAAGHQGPLLDYYDAAVLWEKGDRAKAIEKMQVLSKANPEEKRFSETLTELLKDPEGDAKGKFSSRLSVHFDLTEDKAGIQAR